ncbi:hypothetical protein [Natronobiforma cellulositropha]|uniref:hypothetical protein n=1 Tax=Natronobiforma cellulositropha TaxID=1679076 RepID=UPI0021D5B2CA|nr:hypothetical protein [Natronobiforma cellulositropha]
MAREPPVTADADTDESPAETQTRATKPRLLNRRAYLGLTAGAVAGVIGASGVATARDAGYELIEVPAGTHEVIHVEDGETFENVLFDQTANNASVSLVAHGTNWTVRNVAWRGEFSHQSRALTCSDRGGNTSRVENVYIGDGVDDSVGAARHPQLGIWVAPEHSGRLEFDGVYVEGANDNAFYASAPGTNANGQRGTVHFTNCYAKDNWVSGFRLAGGTVENCVAVNTGRNDGRPLWVWPGRDGLEVEVRDSHFISGNYAHGYDFGQSGQTTHAAVVDSHYAPADSSRFQGNVQLEEENVGHEPRDFVPEGCPDSPDAVFDA